MKPQNLYLGTASCYLHIYGQNTQSLYFFADNFRVAPALRVDFSRSAIRGEERAALAGSLGRLLERHMGGWNSMLTAMVYGVFSHKIGHSLAPSPSTFFDFSGRCVNCRASVLCGIFQVSNNPFSRGLFGRHVIFEKQ